MYVFCVDLTKFVLVAFEIKYVKAKKRCTYIVSDKNVAQRLLVSGAIIKLVRIFAGVRCINREKLVCVPRSLFK